MTTRCVKPGSMGTVLWNILSAPSMSREKAGAPRGPLTLTTRFGHRVVTRLGTGGVPEFVVRQDRHGHYVAPGTVNGVEVEFLLDTGATNVRIPHALALRLGLKRGVPVEIVTVSDVAPGYPVTLDEVSVGPLTLERVRGRVTEQAIHDEVSLYLSLSSR